MIRMGVTISDGVQWDTGGPNTAMDSGKFSALFLAESVVEDSTRRIDDTHEFVAD